MRAPLLSLLIVASACDEPGPARAQSDETVRLRATNDLGVPLHPQAGSRAVSGRLPDGAEVTVEARDDDGHWLRVRAADGTTGWIVERYVDDGRDRPARPPDAFTSREACEALLRARDSDRARPPRVGSWNLRWFPDGTTGGPGDRATDVAHLACVIAWLDVDALAVQEIVLHDRGRAATRRLTAALDRHTGGRWRAVFDGCPRDSRQHVGWLVNEARVDAGEPTQLDGLNPAGGCAHHLRPGLAVHLRFGDDGPDLHAITVHLDAGTEARDHGHRARSHVALEAAIGALRPRDPDVLVIGDLNTMGRRVPRVSASDEIAALDATIAGLNPALRRLPNPLGCSEFYRRHGSLLDHALVTTSSDVLASDGAVRVEGPCARYRCELPRGAHPAALEHLSDHCPLLVDLRR